MPTIKELILIRERARNLPHTPKFAKSSSEGGLQAEVFKKSNELIWAPRPEWLRKPRARQDAFGIDI